MYRINSLMGQFPPIAHTVPMDIVVAYGTQSPSSPILLLSSCSIMMSGSRTQSTRAPGDSRHAARSTTATENETPMLSSFTQVTPFSFEACQAFHIMLEGRKDQ